MGYSRETLIGLSWMSGFRVISRAISTIRIIILARIITPTQFGVFSIASITLSFLEILTETGINVFLVQERDRIDRFVNSAWIVSILRGIILSLIIFISTPFIVTFFKLSDLSRFLILISLVPLIRGFINPSIVKFQKELQFNKEFFLRFFIFIFDSVVSVTLALIWHDAISFVWGLVAGAIFEVILSFVFFRPLPLFKFEFNNAKTVLNHGKWVTAYGIFNYIAQNGDNIVVGKLLGSTPLGIYQMGYTISSLPISEISDVANKVVFPVYAKISDDKMRLIKAFKKTILLISLPVVTLSLIIYFLPQEFFNLVLGTRWIGITSILKILVFYGMLRAITGISSSLFLALRKQNFVAGMTFIRFLTLMLTIVPFTLNYGIIGASYSALLSVLLEIPFIIFYIWKIFKTIGILER